MHAIRYGSEWLAEGKVIRGSLSESSRMYPAAGERVLTAWRSQRGYSLGGTVADKQLQR